MFKEVSYPRKGCDYWPYTAQELTGLNAVDEFGRTRLMRAVGRRDIAEGESLLKQGASPNIQAAYPYYKGREIKPRYAGLTALILAVEIDYVEYAKLLLTNKANPSGFALYTDPGMGTYTVRPRDYCRSEEMENLLNEYKVPPERGEFLWVMHNSDICPRT